MRKKPNAAFFYFNSQPREGGWIHFRFRAHIVIVISTHSRAKAAGA